MKYLDKILIMLLTVFVLSSCSDELEVPNENQPDRGRAITSPEDLLAILKGGFTNAWTANYSGSISSVYENPKITFDALGDALTTTNAFQRIWDFTNEPRISIDNTLTYSGLQRLQNPWRQHNFAINAANQMIRAIEEDGFTILNSTEDDVTQMALASAYFLRGYSKGYLGIMFDQAYIADAEGFDATNPTFSPYEEVVESGVSDLDVAIQIANSNSFATDEWWPGIILSSTELAEWANTMAAKFLISKGRTAAEYDNTLWTRIRDYALDGLSYDIVVASNNNTVGFVDFTKYVSGSDWFLRIDYRVMSKLSNDPNFPLKHPLSTNGAPISETTSDDARFSDFAYTTSQTGLNPARGIELFSFWNYSLNDEVADLWADLIGNYSLYRKTENDLMLAEAYVRLGNSTSAVPLVNLTRVPEGGLAAVSAGASSAEVLEAIEYELDIELYRTGFGISYFMLRRNDALQVGTPLHLPVPADELAILGLDPYTFGGAGNPGSASGSNSWFTN